jgi:hypothetical protein
MMWNPDAILFNSHLQWRIANSRTLSVAAGDGPRRCEIQLLLDQSGDAVTVWSIRWERNWGMEYNNNISMRCIQCRFGRPFRAISLWVLFPGLKPG